MKSMKKSLIASYAGQLYAALLNIIIVPVLLRLVGAEAYGLVGFFTMIQGWLLLMDAGMSPTLGRAASRYKSGNYSASEFKYLIRFANRIFLSMTIIFLGCSIPASGWIAAHWLNVHILSVRDVVFSIVVMLIAVAIRWRIQPYRSVIIGMEKQLWLNSFNAVMVSLRTIGAVLLVWVCGPDIKLYFSYQLAIAILEALGMAWEVKKITSKENSGKDCDEGKRPDLVTFGKMSLTLMLTTTAWTLLTQVDRLILSKKVSLSDFGIFSMAVLCASGVTILTGPLTSVLGPRLTILLERCDTSGALAIYRASTRFSVSVVLNAAFILALFSDHLLFVWCGDASLAAKVSPIMFWYVLGNGFQAMTSLFYSLQYAHGNLRLHLVGCCLLAILVVPVMFWAASTYGAIGTGMVWCGQAIIYLFVWGSIVHWRLLPAYQWKWFFHDLLPGFLPTAIVGYLLKNAPFPWGGSRLGDFLYFVLCITVCAFVSVFTNVDVIRRFRGWQRSWVMSR
ncbi:lipopolysaccharide biosynthesis protein [Paraburkholderia flagellata]|uniref:lipopolysaccharide biosynthesis protein n=1 Tax=Paraburkholderia flagellata TaxID=2883241 RepID=UPI001F484CAD|nr:lipopolysaccharide biosynthesis protein [Paraburkholderia flagellata]